MNTRVNVAIDATIIDGTVGGVQNVIESLAQGFRNYNSQDFNFYWLVLHYTEWWKLTIPKSHNVIKVGRFSALFGKRMIKHFPKITRIVYENFYNQKVHNHNAEIKKILVKNNIQILHTPFQNGFTTKSIPYIYHPHDLQHKYLPENFSQKEIRRRETLWKRKAQGACLNIVETRFVQNDLEIFWKVPRNKIRRIITPPPKFPISKQKNCRKPYAIYQASFWNHKNHVRLIEAFRILENSGVSCDLYLIGNFGKSKQTIVNLIEKNSLKHRVRLTGYISRKELSEYLSGCEVVVIPSLFESLSLPGFEALQAQKKVVCSNIREFRYQFGSHAIFFDPYNANDIAVKIAQALDEDKENKINILKYDVSKLNPEEFAKAICGAYKQVLNIEILLSEKKSLKLLENIGHIF